MSRLSVAAAALLAVTALAGCSAPARPVADPPPGPALPAGSSTHSIEVGGVSRTYIVYRPASLPAAAPLVVMLHGGFGSASQAEKSYGWDAEADRGHFVVAYPDGLGHAWNTGGGCCGTPGRTGTDDVGFITAMVSAVERAVPVDAARVYATGISNGGIMAYTRIPYQGGEGEGVAHIDGPSVPSLNARWRDIDHCAAPAVRTTGAVTTSMASCPAGRAVELITIAGAGHQWPGSAPRPLIQRILGTDPPSTALNATQVIWQFFAAHPR